MNGFVVEVPAETNPFSHASLRACLQNAASNDAHQIQSSTKQLQQWETSQGYYSALQDVYIQRDGLPLEVRMLSLIQLKNGIDKYWRKSAANAISADERSTIRGRLLQSSVSESNDRLASLNSIVTAKIARYDFPGQWQDLFPQLLDLVKSAASPEVPDKNLSRALLITHHVIKELATVRLQRTRASLFSAAPSIFRVLRDCYFFKVQQWQDIISRDNGLVQIQAMHSMDVSEQTLKILRRLIVAGYDFPHRNEEVGEFWSIIATHMQLYLQMLHQAELPNAYRISASQHVKQLAKFHLAVVKEHPVSFVLFPGTIDLVRSYWGAAKELRQLQLSSGDLEEDASDIYNVFNLHAVLILRACFKEAFQLSQPFKYRNSDGKDEPPKARKILSDQLLTHDFLREVFQSLVSKFFIQVQNEIEEFFTEPEEWDMKDEGDEEAYEKSLRPAAERLFMDICLHYKDIVVGPLLDTLASLSNSSESNIPLLKDAVYAAIGVAAPILHTKFDFDNFLVNTLVLDLQQNIPMYSIVRRRIAIVLARWTPVDVADQNRPLIYEIFQGLLDKDNELNKQAVRIAAGKRLNDVVDEIAFRPEAFVPFAANVLSALLDLIREVDTAETKLALLNTVSTVVERMDADISAFSNQIISILQALWAHAANENMMKTVIVTILSKLVKAMKTKSTELHGMMMTVIKDALEPGSESQIYLLDDALDLWTEILKHTASPPPRDLMDLVPLLFHLYDLDEGMYKALRITKSYILLDPTYMLQDNMRGKLFESFRPLVKVRDTKTAFEALESVTLMIRASEAIGGQQGVQQVTIDMMSHRLLVDILESLNQSWETRQTTGPKRKDPPPDWKNETDYLCVLSRIILPSTPAFVYAMTTFAESKHISVGDFTKRILEEAFSHMDAVGRPTDGKLICLAVTKLLETGQTWILEKLQDLMALWTSTIVELRDGKDDKTGDSLVYQNTVPPNEDVAEEARSHALTYSDPVHTIHLWQFVKHYLRNCVEQSGGEEQFQETWLVNVDKDVSKAFGKLGVI